MTIRRLNLEPQQFERSSRVELCTRSESETLDLAAVLAQWLRPGDVILLHGNLGAGKTVLAKGIARRLGVTAHVTSPSFALVNEYSLAPGSPIRHLYHLDLYRLETLEDLETIGFSDIVAEPTAITLVEWPERAHGALPDRYLLMEINTGGEETRVWSISGSPADAEWQERLAALDRLVRAACGAELPQ